MCRAPITPVQAYDIFEQTRVRPIMLGTFALPTEVQPIVMETINAVNAAAATNPINASLQQILMFRFAEASKRVSPQIIGQAIDLFEGALQHFVRFNTYEGFGAGGDSEGLIYGSDEQGSFGVNPGQAAADAYLNDAYPNPVYEDESTDGGDDEPPPLPQLQLPSLSPLQLPAPAIPLSMPVALEAPRHYSINIAPVQIPVPVPVPAPMVAAPAITPQAGKDR
jgi:hypothetical protein